MADTDKKQKTLDTSTMSLGDHLDELRARLIYSIIGILVCSVLGFVFGSRIIAFIQIPYTNLMPDTPLQILGPAEGFVSYVKISLISGLLLSSPWVFYHLWMFVAAGLYSNEKKYVFIAAPCSALLFIAGAMFFIFVVGPLTLGFLIKFNENFLRAKSQFNLQKYISFVIHLVLVFGIAFQTPTAIFFLNRTGLVSLKALTSSRKYVVLLIVILAAMATPPDFVSQVALAIPLYFLFELGIILSYIASRKKKSQGQQ